MDLNALMDGAEMTWDGRSLDADLGVLWVENEQKLHSKVVLDSSLFEIHPCTL